MRQVLVPFPADRETPLSDAKPPIYSFETVCRALQSLDAETVAAAIDAGFDVHQKDAQGRSLIFYAHGLPRRPMLKLLWQAGIEPHCTVIGEGFIQKVFASFAAGGDGILGHERARLERRSNPDLEDWTGAFSVDRLTPERAVLRALESIEIVLVPFRLDDEVVDTSIRLDDIALPDTVEALEQQAFSFPVNPADGYIDGTVYIQSRHNPVDVTHISFGRREPDTDTILATLQLHFDFDQERVDLPSASRSMTVALALEDCARRPPPETPVKKPFWRRLWGR